MVQVAQLTVTTTAHCYFKLTTREVGHGSVPAGEVFRDNVTPITSLLAFLRPNHKTCLGTASHVITDEDYVFLDVTPCSLIFFDALQERAVSIVRIDEYIEDEEDTSESNRSRGSSPWFAVRPSHIQLISTSSFRRHELFVT
jgi:hypothetical protein